MYGPFGILITLNWATVLWPIVAEMARDETYLTVNDVLTFALDSDYSDPKDFEAALRQEVAKAYLKLSKIDFENTILSLLSIELPSP